MRFLIFNVKMNRQTISVFICVLKPEKLFRYTRLPTKAHFYMACKFSNFFIFKFNLTIALRRSTLILHQIEYN